MEHLSTPLIRRSAAAVLILLAVFLFAESLGAFKQIGVIGEGIAATNTITVSGKGEIFAAPDIATVTFDVTSEAATVSDAQNTVTGIANDALSYVKSQGVDPKDIQTVGYDISPRYEYQTQPYVCPVNSYCNPPTGTRVFKGYDVTESVSVKIRDLSKAGAILAGLGSKKITNLSGLSFSIDQQDAVQAQARDKAIADAKSKAEALASALGVQLVRVVSFSESGPMPVYYAMAAAVDSKSAGPAVPTIEPGQSKVDSTVSVTYEIR